MFKKVFKVFLNYKKEEAWLNEMADRGLLFIHYSWGSYTFEEGKAGEYIYRIHSMKKRIAEKESAEHVEFLKDPDIEMIAHSTSLIYYRKKTSAGDFKN